MHDWEVKKMSKGKDMVIKYKLCAKSPGRPGMNTKGTAHGLHANKCHIAKVG